MAYRVEIEFPYLTGLPRDVAINVINIRDGLDIGDSNVGDIITEALASMYFTGVSGMTSPLGAYMSEIVDRPHCNFRLHRFDAAPGDPPVYQSNFGVADTAGSNVSLPLQVAMCVSFLATGPTIAGAAELPLRRRRGRVFFGPINSAAVLHADDAAHKPHPQPNFLTDLARAWGWLAGSSVPGGDGSGLMVWSQKAGDGTIVTSGHVDDEWDVQRRRGIDPTHRTPFDLSPIAP